MSIFKPFGNTGPAPATGRASSDGFYKKDLGGFGERRAAHWLKKMGLTIVQMNYRCRFGEVDIIARDGDELAFIEVKTRTNTRDFLPCEAVNRKKQEHIRACAEYYILENDLSVNVRFDVVEVYASPFGREFRVDRIHHIKDAFQ